MTDTSPGTTNAAEPLTARDIAAVLSHFDLGEIESVRTLDAGSSRAPKAVVTTSFSMYLLKRIADSRADRDRLRRQHRVLRVLASSGFPVATLQLTTDGNSSLVEFDGHLHEVSRWIDGRRYDFTVTDARAAGSAMSIMHDLLQDSAPNAPLARGYHARPDVTKAARFLAASSTGGIRAGFKSLAVRMAEAGAVVAERWEGLRRTVVHGDWHPGNLLFGDDHVKGVIDFESARVEPGVSDLANGLLQFTLRRDPGSTVDSWPIAADLELVHAMASGYRLVARNEPDHDAWTLVPDLMIEALAVETIVTVHRKGRVRDIDPALVVPWINARIDWIDANRDNLRQATGIQS